LLLKIGRIAGEETIERDDPVIVWVFNGIGTGADRL